MAMKRVVLSVVALGLCAATGMVSAQTGGGGSSSGPLRVEGESQQVSGDRAVISGYVYNRHEMRVENVRVRIEAADPASRPNNTRVVSLLGTVSSRGRGYFEASMPAAGAPYRITVDSFQWSGCGDG